jgi:general secretion pathway protein K
VLWLVVALAATAAAVSASARDAGRAAANARAAAVARHAAESGVVAAVAEIEARLATLHDTLARRAYLNRLDRALATPGETALGDARFRVALDDVSARLDVNEAGADALAALLARVAPAPQARAAADAVDRWTGAAGLESGDLAARMRAGRGRRPLRSLDDLRLVPGFPERLALAAAPYLTVDGDGRVNRRTAAAPVLAAARGTLVDEPSRILVISRGWRVGYPLTHEVQAVYEVAGDRLTFVRWRERTL